MYWTYTFDNYKSFNFISLHNYIESYELQHQFHRRKYLFFLHCCGKSLLSGYRRPLETHTHTMNVKSVACVYTCESCVAHALANENLSVWLRAYAWSWKHIELLFQESIKRKSLECIDLGWTNGECQSSVEDRTWWDVVYGGRGCVCRWIKSSSIWVTSEPADIPITICGSGKIIL